MGSVYDFDNIGLQHITHFVESEYKMLEYINSRMMKLDNFSDLIGGNKNTQVMLDNHRNHIAFMANDRKSYIFCQRNLSQKCLFMEKVGLKCDMYSKIGINAT